MKDKSATMGNGIIGETIVSANRSTKITILVKDSTVPARTGMGKRIWHGSTIREQLGSVAAVEQGNKPNVIYEIVEEASITGTNTVAIVITVRAFSTISIKNENVAIIKKDVVVGKTPRMVYSVFMVKETPRINQKEVL